PATGPRGLSCGFGGCTTLFRSLVQLCLHGADTGVFGCRPGGLQTRLCRLTAFAVFQNGGDLGVTVAVRTRLGKANRYVKIPAPVDRTSKRLHSSHVSSSYAVFR